MRKIKRSYQARGYCVQRNRGGDSMTQNCVTQNNFYSFVIRKTVCCWKSKMSKHTLPCEGNIASDLTYAVTNRHTGMLRLSFIPYELMVKNVCTFIEKRCYSKSAIITATAKTVHLPYTLKKKILWSKIVLQFYWKMYGFLSKRYELPYNL